MKGHVEKRPGSAKNVWTLVLEPDRVKGEPRKRIYDSFYAERKKDAEAELRRRKRELETGTDLDPTSLTTKAYLEEWLETYGKPNLSHRTLYSYTKTLELHVIPEIGRVQLRELKPIHLQRLYKNVASEGARKDGRSGRLSDKSLTYIHRVLHKALNTAVVWQLVERNVADAVEPPKTKKEDKPETEMRMRVLNEKELAILLRAAKDTPYYRVIFMAAMTGMRRGEIYGLKWTDVDLIRGKVHVRQSLAYSPDKGLFLKSTKTKKSQRTVDISPAVVDMLKQLRAHQEKRAEELKELYTETDLVFCHDDGSTPHPDSISSWFPNFTARVTGMPQITFHELRHTHATLLLKQGVPVNVVSERLGHATKTMTMDVYSHALPSQQEAAATMLDKFVGEVPKPKVRARVRRDILPASRQELFSPPKGNNLLH